MIDPLADLSILIRQAVTAAFGTVPESVDLVPRRSEHADYQLDAALALARTLRRSPREVATAIVAHLPPGPIIEAAAVSGPGFINLTCRAQYLATQLGRMVSEQRLGIDRAAVPQTVVVDYSSPNLAKEMHVGHLRSTIIGDCLVRTLEFLGHSVIRQNHIGDWGTPFGMLLEQMLEEGSPHGGGSVRELSTFYRAARAHFDSDPGFAERARARVVLLQRGDAQTLVLWQRLLELTTAYIATLYRRLHVRLTEQDIAGESRYNPFLESVVTELEDKHLAQTSDGAICVFPPGFSGRDGKPLPLIVRKQDGGFGYAATDLAAIKYRIEKLGARRILYVVGIPQSQHFAMVFETARLAGWASADVRLEHVAFGSVLGQDGKVLKTRAGEAISLLALIDEAVMRATGILDQASPELAATDRARIAEMVGIGAVKYADLGTDRSRDYVFQWDRMLAFDGNTAPYLMYAHARICSMLRKAGAPAPEMVRGGDAIRIEAPAERALALELLGFPATVTALGESLQPHRLCQQLFQTATAFTRFYDTCPVLAAEPAVRASRLALSALTARILACGLDLLGIGAPELM
ncbi:MAG TPA: arginine--tRNA ligase [Steroidobacteraceae bacterium]|nr:arginine--tRNA ligase [Steroidobacteraceae bacterium]